MYKSKITQVVDEINKVPNVLFIKSQWIATTQFSEKISLLCGKEENDRIIAFEENNIFCKARSVSWVNQRKDKLQNKRI